MFAGFSPETVLVRITIENNKVKLTPLGFKYMKLGENYSEANKVFNKDNLETYWNQSSGGTTGWLGNNNFELDGYGIKNIQFTYNKTSVKNLIIFIIILLNYLTPVNLK